MFNISNFCKFLSLHILISSCIWYNFFFHVVDRPWARQNETRRAQILPDIKFSEFYILDGQDAFLEGVTDSNNFQILLVN